MGYSLNFDFDFYSKTEIRSLFNFPLIHVSLKTCSQGAWVARLVKHPSSAQVMISRFVSSGLMSGSAQTAQSLEPASDSVSPFLSAPPPLTRALSLSLTLINK